MYIPDDLTCSVFFSFMLCLFFLIVKPIVAAALVVSSFLGSCLGCLALFLPLFLNLAKIL